MKIEICDICGNKMYEYDKKYKIKVKEISYEDKIYFTRYYWDKIDVCCFCKDAIVELSKKNRKGSENDIN